MKAKAAAEEFFLHRGETAFPPQTAGLMIAYFRGRSLMEAGFMTKFGFLFAGATLAGAIGVLSAPASAQTVTIGLQEAGTNSGNITNEGSAVGTNSFNGSYGTFNINNVSGTVGVLPDLLNSNAINQVSSSVAGTLDVWVTYSGLTSPLGSNTSFLSTLTSNAVPAGWTVTEKTFIDPSNGLFATTDPLANSVFTAIGTDAQSATASTGAGPYSVTEEYIIAASGTTGTANDTIDISASAPEPATWMMMLFGLFGVGAVLRGTRNQRALAGV
jgi:hypothetical protein